MTRMNIVVLAFVALLPLSGCKRENPTSQPPKITAFPTSQQAPPVSDAAREEDERFKREVEAKRRKSHSADIDKTDAYRKYMP